MKTIKSDSESDAAIGIAEVMMKKPRIPDAR
jgi:hypothetical protein